MTAVIADTAARRTVIGPVVIREGGYAFDLWTPETGLTRSFCYGRVEDACHARKFEIRSRPGTPAAAPTACATLDEFASALRRQQA
jgi:hypothetical protein